MKAGSLSSRLEFYKKVDTTADALQNVQRVWELQFTMAAEITQRLGGETVTQARLSGKNIAVINVRRSRQSSEITSDWKAIDTRSGAEWNIRSALESADRATMNLLAETGVPV